MTTRIDSPADIALGLDYLKGVCPVLARIARETLELPLRRTEGGFPGLVRIVVAQQLSVKAAQSIQARLEALVPDMAPDRFLEASDAELRAVGLSAGKVRTLRAAAHAAIAGDIAFDLFHASDTEEVHRHLTVLPGIGPWTADVYCLFCLGHGDAFAPGDLALQEAARIAFDLPERPKVPTFLAMAEAWRPWRGVAARLLWAYYRVVKAREGIAG